MPDTALLSVPAAPAAPPARRFHLRQMAAALLAVSLMLATAPAMAEPPEPLDTPLGQGGQPAPHRVRPTRVPICISLFLRDCGTPDAVRRSDDEQAEPPIGSVAFRLSRLVPNRAALRPGQPGAPATRTRPDAAAAQAAGGTSVAAANPSAPAQSPTAAQPAPAASRPAPPAPADEGLDAVRGAIQQLGMSGAISVERSPNGADLVLSFPAQPRGRR